MQRPASQAVDNTADVALPWESAAIFARAHVPTSELRVRVSSTTGIYLSSSGFLWSATMAWCWCGVRFFAALPLWVCCLLTECLGGFGFGAVDPLTVVLLCGFL